MKQIKHITLITTLILLIFIHLDVNSQPIETHHEHGHHTEQELDNSTTPKPSENCNNQLIAQVNGLVCDFCARALEKVFGKRAEVSGIDVDLDQGYVTIEFNPNQSISHDQLTAMITDSGYNVVKFIAGCDS